MDPRRGKEIIWQDEFTSLDKLEDKWDFFTGVRGDAILTKNQIEVSNGILSIKLKRVRDKYETSFISSKNTESIVHGFFEARIKAYGTPGAHCAFWLQSPLINDGFGALKSGVEVDIMEFRARDQFDNDVSDLGHMAVHWGGYGKDHRTINSYYSSGSKILGEWGVYGVEWTESGYDFYVNDELVWKVRNAVSGVGEQIRLTCESKSGGWAGHIPVLKVDDDSEVNIGIQVDWVKVWK